jgi:hypothetical protein
MQESLFNVSQFVFCHLTFNFTTSIPVISLVKFPSFRTDVHPLIAQVKVKLALGITKYHAIKMHGGVEAKLHTFLT